MESLNPKFPTRKLPSSLFDPFRRIWVRATAEEVVRQVLLKKLIQDLGFPPQCISIEKDLRQLPHLANSAQKIPNRRADIICYAKDIHADCALFPLLLIECKAIKITEKVLQQVISYNDFVQSRFVAVANQEQSLIAAFDETMGSYRFYEKIPHYQDLIRLLA